MSDCIKMWQIIDDFQFSNKLKVNHFYLLIFGLAAHLIKNKLGRRLRLLQASKLLDRQKISFYELF